MRSVPAEILDPPPDDPWDAVTSLELLDAARVGAAEGQVVEPGATRRPG